MQCNWLVNSPRDRKFMSTNTKSKMFENCCEIFWHLIFCLIFLQQANQCSKWYFECPVKCGGKQQYNKSVYSTVNDRGSNSKPLTQFCHNDENVLTLTIETGLQMHWYTWALLRDHQKWLINSGCHAFISTIPLCPEKAHKLH